MWIAALLLYRVMSKAYTKAKVDKKFTDEFAQINSKNGVAEIRKTTESEKHSLKAGTSKSMANNIVITAVEVPKMVSTN